MTLTNKEIDSLPPGIRAEVRRQIAEQAKKSPIAAVAVDPPDKGMNKLETRYSLHLDYQKELKLVDNWKYEAAKLRLAYKTFYTPDFMVQLTNGQIEFHETKGFLRDDAAAKIKVAASIFPMFRFKLVYGEEKGWKIIDIGVR